MSAPPFGSPAGLGIAAKDVARGSEFYTKVFNWKFEPSHMGIPAHKLLSFTVPGSAFSMGCAMTLAEDHVTGKDSTKIYLYVDDLATTIKAIEENGGKKVSEAIPEGSKGFFQFFEDTEGNHAAIYTLAK